SNLQLMKFLRHQHLLCYHLWSRSAGTINKRKQKSKVHPTLPAVLVHLGIFSCE
ncbi:hypothetical protein L9F63_013729, partial [Diploptera punctata]